MESSKFLALLFIFMLFVSAFPSVFACGTCPPKPVHRKRQPVVHPPLIKPPPVVVPPITVPPITVPPVTPILPPVIPILPPVVAPPVLTPPIVTPGCPPPPAPLTCPVDTLKIGACVDLLGGLLNVKIGDPAANRCCPVLGGLLELEAAVCLCTTIKIKLLNLDLYLPIALKLLATCGKTPPPGYSCKA